MGPLFVHLAETERNMDQRIGIWPACFEHEDPIPRIRAQPVGQQTARASRADDNVIVFLRPAHAAGLPCFSARRFAPRIYSLLSPFDRIP